MRLSAFPGSTHATCSLVLVLALMLVGAPAGAPAAKFFSSRVALAQQLSHGPPSQAV